MAAKRRGKLEKHKWHREKRVKKPRRTAVDHYDWQRAELAQEVKDTLLKSRARLPDEVWVSSIYQVLVYRNVQYSSWPPMHWLSIKRRDKGAIDDWRVKQKIKNDLLGDEFEAVELFPAESRLVDSSNQYHLWALAKFVDGKPLQFPFGYKERLVVKGHDEGEGGSKQRSFEKDPDDAADADTLPNLKDLPGLTNVPEKVADDVKAQEQESDDGV